MKVRSGLIRFLISSPNGQEWDFLQHLLNPPAGTGHSFRLFPPPGIHIVQVHFSAAYPGFLQPDNCRKVFFRQTQCCLTKHRRIDLQIKLPYSFASAAPSLSVKQHINRWIIHTDIRSDISICTARRILNLWHPALPSRRWQPPHPAHAGNYEPAYNFLPDKCPFRTQLPLLPPL